MAGFNLSNGGFQVGLGDSKLSWNTRDGSLGVKISDHLSLNLNGGVDFVV